jgi:hypothetical protein
MASGLAELGFKRGDNLAIIGDNRPRLYWAMAAAQCLGGVPGDDVPGRRGGRDGLRAAGCRHQVRHRRGPGAGRQAARDQGAVPRPASTSSTTTRAACATTTRPSCTASTMKCRRWGASTTATTPIPRRRDRQGQPRRRRRDAVHLGHHRQAEGRLPDPRAPSSRRRSGGCELRPARPRRRHPLLPADGLGGRPPVLLRPGAGGRLHHQLPGIGRDGDDRPARDRPDLLLRAAARVREPADAGDDPHGGRRRRSSATCSITSWTWRGAAAPRSSTASR